MGAENFDITVIRSADRPVRSESLYRLSYRSCDLDEVEGQIKQVLLKKNLMVNDQVLMKGLCGIMEVNVGVVCATACLLILSLHGTWKSLETLLKLGEWLW
jgi:hypothetical protein